MGRYTVVNGLWIIGVLTTLLVVALSVQWASIKDLATIISFAVGLASLILAVIAIFQNLVSTPTLVSSLAEITKATSGLQAAGSDLIEKAALFGTVPNELQGMRERLDVLADQNANRASQPGAEAQALPVVKEAPKAKDGVAEDDEKYTRDLFNRSTNGGRIALYTMARAFQARKLINARNIFSKSSNLGDYTNAFISALKVTGHLDLTSEESGAYIITGIGRFKPEIIFERIESFKKNKDGDVVSYYVDNTKVVDDFFGGNSPSV